MKKIILYCSILGSFFLPAVLLQAQKALYLAPPDLERLRQEDQQRAAEGTFPRCAVGVPVQDFDLSRQGAWSVDAEGKLVWQLSLHVPGAPGLALYFDRLTLPKGALLRVNTGDRKWSEVVHPEDLEPAAGWLSEFFPGESLDLILSLPPDARDDLEMHLEHVAVAYRMLYFPLFPAPSEKDFGDADACQVNARCSPEGDNWQDQRRSVVRILLKEGSSYGWCSGALINNTNQDCTPYVLTANHCGAGASAADFRNWKYYFNYEAPTCANPSGEGTLATQTVTGSMKVASSSESSSIFRSDFLLTILKIRPLASYNAYLAGWSTSNTGSPSGVGIHHPSGDIKKISTYSQTLLSTTWGGTPGTHWQVKWVATANGHGVTEEGSSGSPIFNNSKLIVGQLSGGSSFCSQPNNPDAYGKFWYSWDQTGTTANRRLKSWLDRNNTNATTLNGRQNNCASATLPTVDFTADQTNVMAGQTVTFTDLTTGSPFAWSWTVSPSTFSFTGGTSAQSQNPKMVFNAQGNYTITLTAANTAGYETKVRSAYIKVTGNIGVEDFPSDPLQLSFYPNPAVDFVRFDAAWDDVKSLWVSVFDAEGRLVQHNLVGPENATLPLAFQREGLYVVRVRSQNGLSGYYKLIKMAP
ncbi:MAG: PKD domain-containing protein [Flavobacteriales bacterium]|nr:PKD domain-containing protein [Flavobacteriales bacterium]